MIAKEEEETLQGNYRKIVWDSDPFEKGRERKC